MLQRCSAEQGKGPFKFSATGTSHAFPRWRLNLSNLSPHGSSFFNTVLFAPLAFLTRLRTSKLWLSAFNEHDLSSRSPHKCLSLLLTTFLLGLKLTSRLPKLIASSYRKCLSLHPGHFIRFNYLGCSTLNIPDEPLPDRASSPHRFFRLVLPRSGVLAPLLHITSAGLPVHCVDSLDGFDTLLRGWQRASGKTRLPGMRVLQSPDSGSRFNARSGMCDRGDIPTPILLESRR